MPPNDLEAGLNGSSQPAGTDGYIPEFEKPPQDHLDVPRSAAPSIVPSAVDRSADPDLKDVWNKWMGKPSKEAKKYTPPPQKGERYELETFQNLVGIHFLRPGGGMLNPEDQGTISASPLHDIFMPTKAASRRWRNRGLYERSLSQDVRSRVLYGMANYLISFLYLLQILIAAALTGLSAYQQSSSVALTVLGAINTVLAGILAWLNGQGMPVRFRRARDQFREVVRAIEDTERTFAEIDYIDWAPGTRPNPYAERDRLDQMYEEARQDLERNYPDIQEGPNKSQMEGEAKQLKETISGEKSKVGAFAKTLEKTRDDHKKQLKDLEEGFTQRIKNALKDQEDRVRTEVEFKHLQKIAEEQKRKYDEEKAEYEARLGRPRQPRQHSPQPKEQERKSGKAPEKPKEEAKPREEPHDGPRGGKPRSGSPGESQARPREVPRERSRARSPSRPRAKSPARSPVRAPARQSKSPVKPRARSPSRSPARPRARSPSRSPVRPAKSSPKPRARSPARSPARTPAAAPARSPVRPAKTPSRASSNSPARRPGRPTGSPARPSARSPARSPVRPAKSPSRSPPRSTSRPRAKSPSRSSSRPRAKSPERKPPGPRNDSPDAGPRSDGPPGLFTNIF